MIKDLLSFLFKQQAYSSSSFEIAKILFVFLDVSRWAQFHVD